MMVYCSIDVFLYSYAGAQSTTPTLGNTAFGQSTFGAQAAQRVGNRVTPYQGTSEPDSNGVGKLESISAMPAYKEKSHEELRWEDYQAGDKGIIKGFYIVLI